MVLGTKRILFIVPLMVVLIVGFGSSLYIEYKLQEWLENRIKSEMIQSAKNVRETLSLTLKGASSEEVDSLVDSLGAVNSYRITVIASDGKVLGDSSIAAPHLRELENYKNRPEITEAIANGIGISLRHSETFKADMMYVAIPYELITGSGFVRVSTPLIEIENIKTRFHYILIAVSIIALIIVVLLSGLAASLLSRAISKEQSQLELRVEERTRELALLQELGKMLTACESLDEATAVISSTILKLFGKKAGSLSIIKPRQNIVESICTWGDGWPGEALFAPNDCWALRQGRQHLTKEEDMSLVCNHLRPPVLAPILCIPLVAQGNNMGVLHLMESSGTQFTEGKIQLSASVAEHVSLALASIELRQELREQAIRDPLTNLFNRRYLEESLEREIRRAERQKKPIGIMMIDIDHFKQFNDEYGHDAGDLVLKEFGSFLKQISRGEDIPCRYGGEEFTLIIPGASLHDTNRRAVELCERTKKMLIRWQNKPLPAISVSIGVAAFPEHGSTSNLLLSSADEALYRAKEEGRDRVCLAS